VAFIGGGGVASGIWTNHNEIVYTALGKGLFRVSADGGAPTRLLVLDPGDRSNDIAIVPTTGDILFTSAASGEPRIELLNAHIGAAVPVADDARLVALTTTGHLLFERDDVIMAAVFDAPEHRLGPAVPVLDGYARDSARETPQVAVSASGTLVYVAAAESAGNSTLEWVDVDGTLERVGDLPDVGGSMVDLSPDGRLAVVGTFEARPRVFVWDMVRQVPTGLDVEGVIPRWHPDGRHVAFSRGLQLLRIDVEDGSETVLAESDSDDIRSPSFSGDGDTVVFDSGDNILALLPGLAHSKTTQQDPEPVVLRWVGTTGHSWGAWVRPGAAVETGSTRPRALCNKEGLCQVNVFEGPEHVTHEIPVPEANRAGLAWAFLYQHDESPRIVVEAMRA
jgi:dipeptidyl aminopeptidase/acylaminoacyl peptidase